MCIILPACRQAGIMKPIQIYKRDGSLVHFDQSRITTAIYKAAASVGGHNKGLTQELSDKVVSFLENKFPDTIPSVEDIQDIVEKVLIEKGHAKTAKAYILYRQKRTEIRDRDRETEKQAVEENVPYKKLWQVLCWNVDHSCDTIKKLNERIANGTFQKLIKDAETTYNEDISNVGSEIIKNKDKIKVVIIAGPSSSGKTTTTLKLKEKLKKEDIDLVTLNIDNYFFDIDMHPKDEYGDYDFETPEALDLNLINKHLSSLIQGKTVKTPRFDFKTGLCQKEMDKMGLKPNQIILIDTLHGLYDKMTESIPSDEKFKLYIETFCQIKDNDGNFVRWADIRLLRRMIRDYRYRNYDPLKTVGHWHYVRRAEMKHIIPFISKTNYILNGALSYELPILRHHIIHSFPSIIEHYKNDPSRQDAYIRAKRVYELLKSVKEVEDDSCVPKDSLLREFVGGECL